MEERLREIRQDFVSTAQGVTVLVLIVVSGLLALASAALIGWDLSSSYLGWARKVSVLLDLPHRELLGYVLTSLPTLIQIAYVSAAVAGMEFAQNKMFKRLYWISLGLDTTMDTIQMNTGTLPSFIASAGVAVLLFSVFSEFMFIFSGSVCGGLVWRMMEEPELMDLAADDIRRHTKGKAGGNRPKKGGHAWRD